MTMEENYSPVLKESVIPRNIFMITVSPATCTTNIVARSFLSTMRCRQETATSNKGPSAVFSVYRQSQGGTKQWPSVCSVEASGWVGHHGNVWSPIQIEHKLINC